MRKRGRKSSNTRFFRKLGVEPILGREISLSMTEHRKQSFYETNFCISAVFRVQDCLQSKSIICIYCVFMRVPYGEHV